MFTFPDFPPPPIPIPLFLSRAKRKPTSRVTIHDENTLKLTYLILKFSSIAKVLAQLKPRLLFSLLSVQLEDASE